MKKRYIAGIALAAVVGIGAVAGGTPAESTAPTEAPTPTPFVYDLGGQPDFRISIDYMAEQGDCEGLSDLWDVAVGNASDDFIEHIVTANSLAGCEDL